MLQANHRTDLRVFVVWEPVLVTDWTRPGDVQTAYVPDRRAAHFWDYARRLSAVYGGAAKVDTMAHKLQMGFRMKDVVWDTALVYPPGVKWGQPATLMVAPVVKFRDDLAAAIR